MLRVEEEVSDLMAVARLFQCHAVTRHATTSTTTTSKSKPSNTGPQRRTVVSRCHAVMQNSLGCAEDV